MTPRNEATKRRLFDATVELVGVRGYENTSIDDIVERAGLAKGTVYYHFTGKAELMDAVIKDHSSWLTETFKAIEDACSDEPQEAIERLVGALLEFLTKESAYSRLLMSEVWRDDRPWYETLSRTRHESVDTICRVVRSGVDRGEFRADVDPDFAGYALYGMTAFCAVDRLTHDSGRSYEDLHRQIVKTAGAMLRVC